MTILSIFGVKKITNFQVKDKEVYKGSHALTVSCLEIRRATHQSVLSLLNTRPLSSLEAVGKKSIISWFSFGLN